MSFVLEKELGGDEEAVKLDDKRRGKAVNKLFLRDKQKTHTTACFSFKQSVATQICVPVEALEEGEE